MSTIAPDVSREVAADSPRPGGSCWMRRSPAARSPSSAGNASVMVGGDEAAFEKAKPVLLAIGPKVTHIGANGLA